MTTVTGIFPNYDNANAALDNLYKNGFEDDDISVLAQQEAVQEYLAEPTEASATATGAVAGGLAGLLLGITAIALPGVGPVLAAGPLAALIGTTALGVGAGGLLGALVDLGIPESEAEAYIKALEERGIFVSVMTEDDRSAIVYDIFQKSGAAQLSSYVHDPK